MGLPHEASRLCLRRTMALNSDEEPREAQRRAVLLPAGASASAAPHAAGIPNLWWWGGGVAAPWVFIFFFSLVCVASDRNLWQRLTSFIIPARRSSFVAFVCALPGQTPAVSSRRDLDRWEINAAVIEGQCFQHYALSPGRWIFSEMIPIIYC